jgi:hypothetical protein
MPYDKSTQKKYGENPLPQKSSGFKMKGSPMKRNFGIGADSPMKETTMPVRTGAVIDPTRAYDYKSAKIPSFRDMISLEQQQAYAKKVDERRADKKLDRQMRKDLKEESTSENTSKKRDKKYSTTQEQQRKTLESQRKMEEEGPKVNLSEHIVNQPLTLPETKTSYEDATKNEMTDIRREFKDDGSWDPKNNPEHTKIQNKINELYA